MTSPSRAIFGDALCDLIRFYKIRNLAPGTQLHITISFSLLTGFEVSAPSVRSFWSFLNTDINS